MSFSGIITGINAFGGDNLLLNAAAGAFINGRAGDYAVKAKTNFRSLPPILSAIFIKP